MFAYFKLLKAKLNAKKIEENFNSIFLVDGVIHYEVITENKTSYYILDKENKLILHREDDNPAVIHLYQDSSEYCSKRNEKYYLHYHYKNGKLHRENDLPAVYTEIKNKDDYLSYSQNKFYFKNGKLHRDIDDAAFSLSFHSKTITNILNLNEIYLEEEHIDLATYIWFKNGVIHREDNQVAYIVEKNYYQAWLKNGKLHRSNGEAAVIHYPQYDYEWFNRMDMITSQSNLYNVLNKTISSCKYIEDEAEYLFYLNGKEITEEEAKKVSKISQNLSQGF